MQFINGPVYFIDRFCFNQCLNLYVLYSVVAIKFAKMIRLLDIALFEAMNEFCGNLHIPGLQFPLG